LLILINVQKSEKDSGDEKFVKKADAPAAGFGRIPALETATHCAGDQLAQ